MPELAQTAYEAYEASLPVRPLAWDRLPPRMQARWRAVVSAVLRSASGALDPVVDSPRDPGTADGDDRYD